jgi:hypothetical protein
MPDQPEQAAVTDPDNIPEILCDGQVNVSVAGNLATLTFTHVRPDVTKMFKDGTIVPRAAVRARIVISVPNLVAFRDLLNRIIEDPNTPAPPTGGLTHH